MEVRVYEGETTENMKKGAAHFDFTDPWNGNVVLAAHNSGSSGYFKNLKNLNTGDKIIYETKYGERLHKVTSMDIIDDTDYSKLSSTSQNQITLITCVSGQQDKRLAVVATEY